MPTKRTFYLIAIMTPLLHVVFGNAKTWARYTLATKDPGTFSHGTAEIVVNLT